MFRKVLVANRGEIAVRILRGLRELGITGVAVYSEADRKSLHVRAADEAVAIGPAASSESYLHAGRILEAARSTGAEAIHPGYGFLSENADFAGACEQSGITFIGPPAEAIRVMGWKTSARSAAVRAGIPVVPGTAEPVATVEEAGRAAGSIGYPVMLKAAAGGGGKGMRRVASAAGLESAFRDASSEAGRAFQSEAVYLEKWIERPRHIEVQVLGDRYGNMIHLGERECSLQRRHQKLVEECPSPLVTRHPELRRKMGEAAVRAASSVGYVNAGTVEFLVDGDGAFYFLEMNTRLQVEHPVTEMVTGADLVHWQLRIAAGERLALRQEDIAWRGWAIECRVCAEDAGRDFLPCPGKITSLREPSGPGVRVDSGVYEGWTAPVEYDPLLSKLIAWAPSREMAVQRMLRALEEYRLGGIRTNLGFFQELLRDAGFARGELHTGFVTEYLARRSKDETSQDHRVVAALAAWAASREAVPPRAPQAGEASAWRRMGRSAGLR